MNWSFARNLLLLFWGMFFVGCATHTDKLRGIRDLYYAGDVEKAATAIDKQLASRRLAARRESDVLELDRALISLAQGNAQDAERRLRAVRDHFDHLEQSSAAEATLSTLTDDTRRAYAGEDYEKILVRAMLAISNMMHGGGDAVAYSLQIDDKQSQIALAAEQTPQSEAELPAYKRVALGAYLRGAITEESHRDHDLVLRSYEKVATWQPQFASARLDLDRARNGRHSQRGCGVVYVFTFVGRGPFKEEVSQLPSSAALLVADRIVTACGNFTVPPTVAPVKVPAVVRSHNTIDSVQVSLHGDTLGCTETITDVTQLAIEQYDAVFDEIVARAVARRIIKKTTVVATKRSLGVQEGTLANFAMDAGGVAWEATENADTRCWGLLPDKIQVLRLELPAGSHQLAFAPSVGNAPRGQAAVAQVQVEDGRNTYVLANFPGQRLAGRILCSNENAR